MTVKLMIFAAAIIFAPMNPIYGQDSLSLKQSLELALKNNFRMKNGYLEVEAAKQTRNAARTAYFPTISAGAFKAELEEPLLELAPVFSFLENSTIGYINAAQPIFTGGRIIYGNKLAGLGVGVSGLRWKLIQDEVTITTEELYWQVVSLEKKLRTIELYEEMLSSLTLQIEDAYISGIVLKNDVLEVQLEKSGILLDKSKLTNALNLMRMAFCQHIGLPIDSPIKLTDPLIPGAPAEKYHVEHSQVLKDRSEYKLLELSVEAERLQTKIIRGGYLPEAAVGAAYQYLEFDDMGDRSFGMVYTSVSVPISAWWGGSHELKKRKQAEKIAANNLMDNSQKLILQMEREWRNLDDAYTQYLLCKDAKAQAEENMKVNQDSYDNGLTTVSDLLEARARLQQTQDQLTDAISGYRLQRTKYLLVTGRPAYAVSAVREGNG